MLAAILPILETELKTNPDNLDLMFAVRYGRHVYMCTHGDVEFLLTLINHRADADHLHNGKINVGGPTSDA